MKQEARETQSQKTEVRTCCYACKLLETLINKIDILGQLVKRPAVVKNYHYYGPYTENQGPTTYNGPVNSDMGTGAVNSQKDDDGQVSAPVMPHTKVDVHNEQPQEDESDDDSLVVVSKCFKFTSEFTREKVKKIMEDYYHNSNPELALIEIALYDHDLLKNRNDHKPFVEALVAWGLLEIANNEVMDTVLSSIRHKHSSLPKEGGYKGWGPNFQNEKNTCTNIGNELGETMPYRYEEEEKKP